MSKRLPIQYAKILHGVTEGLSREDLNVAIQEFAKLLRDENATKKIDVIAKEYEKLVAASEGRESVHVIAAQELAQTTRAQIKEVFNAAEVSHSTDPELIGGVIVRKGNTIFDASINTQLSKLAQSIS